MSYKTYQVIQYLEWCNPGMLIFVDEDGFVVGRQINPANGLTTEWFDEGEPIPFDPSNYSQVVRLEYLVWRRKGGQQFWSSDKTVKTTTDKKPGRDCCVRNLSRHEYMKEYHSFISG